MQDAYVGDVGDFGKYGLLRLLGYTGLRVAVNWYYVIPKTTNLHNDGKFVQYLDDADLYRHYDTTLFDLLQRLVADNQRCLRIIEKSGIINATFYSTPLNHARNEWHQQALNITQNADVVFLDPDNGLETANMCERGMITEKHVKREELKDYYDRGQSVVLYQHRPQMMSKYQCVRNVLEYNAQHVRADAVYVLEFPKFTNRYYFLFAHKQHATTLRDVCLYMDIHWGGLCKQLNVEEYAT